MKLLAQRGQCLARMRGTAGGDAVRSRRNRRAHRTDDVRRAGLGGAQQYRPVAPGRAGRRGEVEPVANGRRVAAATAVGPLGLWPRSRLPAAHLPAVQGRGRVLRRHPGARSAERGDADQPVAVAGEPASVRRRTVRRTGDGRAIVARSFCAVHQNGRLAGCGRGLRRAPGDAAHAAAAGPHRPRRAVAGVAAGLGHAGPGTPPSPRLASVCAAPVPPDQPARYPGVGRRSAALAAAPR